MVVSTGGVDVCSISARGTATQARDRTFSLLGVQKAISTSSQLPLQNFKLLLPCRAPIYTPDTAGSRNAIFTRTRTPEAPRHSLDVSAHVRYYVHTASPAADSLTFA
jgi:hypothetical protein